MAYIESSHEDILMPVIQLVDLSGWTLKIRQKDFVSNDAYRLLVLGTFVLDSRKNCANESIAGCQDILQQYVESCLHVWMQRVLVHVHD